MIYAKNTFTGFFLCCSILFAASFAQECSAEETVSQWNMVLARVKLPDNWRFFLDLQPRFDLEESQARGGAGARQFLVRPAIGYQFSDDLQIYAGYTLVEDYSPHKTEHDIIEDVIYTHRFDEWKYIQRLRFEQRFLEVDGEVAHRWRSLSQVIYPLPCIDNLSLSLYDELFFHMNDVNARLQKGFGENRAFAGLIIDLPQQTSLSVGYQNQYREGRGGGDDAMNHILLAMLFMNFDAE